MVELNQAFDIADIDTSSFELLPNAKYEAIITGSELKLTKAGTGKYLKVEFTIIDEKFENRKIWHNFNLINPNPDAVKIAEKDLAKLCIALNKTVVVDSIELHDIEHFITVGTKAGSNGFYDQNVIKKWEPKTKVDHMAEEWEREHAK